MRGCAAFGAECRKWTKVRWPARLLGPAPGLKELNLICWGTFIGCFLLPLSFYLWIRVKAGMRFHDLLPIDFIYFYGIGRIVNQYPAAKLYDFSLQLKTFNDICALKGGQTWGPSPYPPLVARFFSLFARFSLERAYFLWFGASLALYLAGITAIVKEVFPKQRLQSSLIFCFALAFPAFLYYTLAVGQLATVAVFSVGLAIYQERHSRPFLGGLAFSVLAYKPTLCLVLLPMLLLTRRFRVLAGFVSGTALWIALATALAGVKIWPAYARMLSLFSRHAGVQGQPTVKYWEYIDFSSLLHSVSEASHTIAFVLLLCVIAAVVVSLATLLWKSAASDRPAQYLAWAVTLTWTLLLNVYVPVYDSILVVIAMVLTLGALRDLEWKEAVGWIVFLGLLIFAVSPKAESFAESHGIKLLTIALFLLGVAQLLLLDRALRRESPPRKSQALAA